MAREQKSKPGNERDTGRKPAPGGPEREDVEYPGGTVEEVEAGRDIPFTGDVVSTRDSTFEENPATGLTADEEDGELVKQGLEKRTRRYESG